MKVFVSRLVFAYLLKTFHIDVPTLDSILNFDDVKLVL